MKKLMTFGEWLLIWFETYKKPNLSPTSIRNIEQVIRLHTPKWLSDKALVKVVPLDIDRAISSIDGGRTKVYTRQTWNAAIKKACNLGYVERNVVDISEPVRYKKKKSHALTIQEQTDFLKRLECSQYKWLMLFYLYSGVRCTEALTICWNDIDYCSELITIRGTKTDCSEREIVLTAPLKEILQEQNNLLKKEKITSDRVFPYVRETVSKNFKRLCPNHHLHELRHTYITRCAECGVNVTVCQALVGHKSADMTLNVYTHVMDEYKRKEALKFDIMPKIYEDKEKRIGD